MSPRSGPEWQSLRVTARLIDLRTCQDSGPGFLAATLRYPLHRVPGECQYVVERSASLPNGGLQTVSLGAGKIPTHALLVVWRSEVRCKRGNRNTRPCGCERSALVRHAQPIDRVDDGISRRLVHRLKEDLQRDLTRRAGSLRCPRRAICRNCLLVQRHWAL